MISSDIGGGLILWDLVFDEPLARFAHGEEDTNVAFRPDNRTALSTSRDGTAALWDLFSANEVRRFEGHEGGVVDVEFTPDGKYVLSAGGSDLRYDVPGVDNSIRQWELETGEQVQILEGHTDVLIDLEVSPDGRRAVSTASDDSVRLWDLDSGNEIRRLEYHSTPSAIAIHPDGRKALIGTGDPSLILWDLETGEILDRFIGHEGSVYWVTFSPDGKTALSGDELASLILWDVENGQQIRRLTYDPHSAIVNVVFSPYGRLAVTQAQNRSVAVWDTETWEIIRIFRENEGASDRNRLDIGPDGRTVVSADNDGNALVWDFVNNEILHSFSSRKHLPVFPAISPDGRFLLLGSQDHTLTLWELETPSLEELREWIEVNRYVKELTCSERAQFQIEPLCDAAVVEAEVIFMPLAAAVEGSDRLTHSAQVGENRGEIALGEWDTWLYEGLAGEALTIRMVADEKPAPDSPEEEQVDLDTFLFLIAPDGSLLESNDDDPSGETAPNSLIEGLVLPVDGTYRIQARSCSLRWRRNKCWGHGLTRGSTPTNSNL
jgi:WD40 repeat protein